jgi:hypothetical protein
MKLAELAYARSGDKGSNANIGVIAYSHEGYEVIKTKLTAEKVAAFFKPMGLSHVVRYELPNLNALNFVLFDVLDGGGSLSLRIDPQGKALGQAILEMEIPDE